MKPAPFRYQAARTVEDALGWLSDEDDAVALAGGQSLVPLLNFRLARPSVLVDLNPIESLSHIQRSEGALRIGALARQATIERSPVVAAGWPLLAEVVRCIGHPAIRSRGTVGGSAAHADPRAELPVALSALGGRFRLRSRAGERVVPAEEMFRGPFSTAIAGGELLTEIEVPPPPAGARMAFCEYARTHGDFALAGAAVVYAPGVSASVVLLAGSSPVRADRAQAALLSGASGAEVAEAAAAELAAPEHRRALIADVVRRAVERVQG